jgi:hypothetical protein
MFGKKHRTGDAIMAPCTLERIETTGASISISQYRIWPQFGGGYDVVARNGHEVERIHARSAAIAGETFSMMVGKYSGSDERQASRDDRDLYAWATGR